MSLKKNLEKELDRVFSIAVRKRDADEYGKVTCCTCPSRKDWSQMTCGHHRKRRHMATRWELRNAGSQCEECNNADRDLSKYLDDKFGKGTSDRMTVLSNKVVHYDINDLREKLYELTQLI